MMLQNQPRLSGAQNDTNAIRRDLERWRELLKRMVDDDARRTLQTLITGAERRLKELEGTGKAH